MWTEWTDNSNESRPIKEKRKALVITLLNEHFTADERSLIKDSGVSIVVTQLPEDIAGQSEEKIIRLEPQMLDEAGGVAEDVVVHEFVHRLNRLRELSNPKVFRREISFSNKPKDIAEDREIEEAVTEAETRARLYAFDTHSNMAGENIHTRSYERKATRSEISEIARRWQKKKAEEVDPYVKEWDERGLTPTVAGFLNDDFNSVNRPALQDTLGGIPAFEKYKDEVLDSGILSEIQFEAGSTLPKRMRAAVSWFDDDRGMVVVDKKGKELGVIKGNDIDDVKMGGWSHWDDWEGPLIESIVNYVEGQDDPFSKWTDSQETLVLTNLGARIKQAVKMNPRELAEDRGDWLERLGFGSGPSLQGGLIDDSLEALPHNSGTDSIEARTFLSYMAAAYAASEDSRLKGHGALIKTWPIPGTAEALTLFEKKSETNPILIMKVEAAEKLLKSQDKLSMRAGELMKSYKPVKIHPEREGIAQYRLRGKTEGGLAETRRFKGETFVKMTTPSGMGDRINAQNVANIVRRMGDRYRIVRSGNGNFHVYRGGKRKNVDDIARLEIGAGKAHDLIRRGKNL